MPEEGVLVDVPPGHWEQALTGVSGGGSDGIWLERELAGGWLLAVRLQLQHGHAVISELRLFPSPFRSGEMTMSAFQALQQRAVAGHRAWGSWSGDAEDLTHASAGGITSELLRKVPLKALRAEAEEWWARAAEALESLDLSDAGWAQQVEAAIQRPRREKRPDAFYARVAGRYVQLLADGDKAPVATMARELTHSPDTVNDWVKEARKRGLLTPTTPGRAGGQLTDEAIAILRNEEK